MGKAQSRQWTITSDVVGENKCNKVTIYRNSEYLGDSAVRYRTWAIQIGEGRKYTLFPKTFLSTILASYCVYACHRSDVIKEKQRARENENYEAYQRGLKWADERTRDSYKNLDPEVVTRHFDLLNLLEAQQKDEQTRLQREAIREKINKQLASVK